MVADPPKWLDFLGVGDFSEAGGHPLVPEKFLRGFFRRRQKKEKAFCPGLGAATGWLFLPGAIDWLFESG